jgi:predicted AAA+ superfamily ATPase
MNGILGEFKPKLDYLGIVCETIIFNQLQAGLAYKNKTFSLSFFRSHSGLEVDFVVSSGGEEWAVEVKSNDHLSSDDMHSLKQFQKINKKAKPFIFHFGKSSRKTDGIWCLSWTEGLKEIIG